MDLPADYAYNCLHIETGVLFLFLMMVLCIQLERAREQTHYVRNAQRQFGGLLVLFVLLVVFFLRSLGPVSPVLALQLAAGITLALLHPVNALCFFVHMLFLRPWELLPDQPILLALPRFLGVIWLISWLMHPQQRGIPSRKSLAALALLMGFSGWTLISTTSASSPGSAQSAWIDMYSKSPMIFVMGLFSLENERSLSQFKWTIVISTLGLMLIGMAQFFAEGFAMRRLGALGVFAGPNELGALIVMSLPFAFFLMVRRARHVLSRIAGLLFAALALGVVWYTRSRGAILAIAVQLVTAYARRRPGQKWLSIVLLMAALGLGYVGIVSTIPRSRGDMEESQESRLIYWKAAVGMTLDHPLRGVGFNQYRENYERYSSARRLEWGKRTAHSSWLLAFAEAGIPGGLLYLAFFFVVLQAAWRNRMRWPDPLYALAGFAVGMTFLSITYSLYFFILAGLIMGSDSVRRRPQHAL